MSIFKDKDNTLKQLFQLELFVSALIPVTAILILAVIGMQVIPQGKATLFIIAFTLCAIISFLGSCFAKMQTQEAVRMRLAELISVCQEYSVQPSSRRVPVRGKDEFAQLASQINKLLDSEKNSGVIHIQQQANFAPLPNTTAKQAQEASLHLQLERLLQEISPITSGDLRARIQSSSKEMGTVADTVNYLQEELIDIIKKVQSASNYILSVTRDLLDRTVEMAHITEQQMQLLVNTTDQIESLVAFSQRLTGILTITREAARSIQQHLDDVDQKTGPLSEQEELPLIKEDVRRQLQLLETFGYTTEEKVAAAEAVVAELYTLAQRIHQASMGVLNAAERVSSLAVMAEEWRNTTEHFQLPEDENEQEQEENSSDDSDEEYELGLLSPYTTTKKRSNI